MNHKQLAANIESYIRDQVADAVDQDNVKHIARLINELMPRWKQYREEMGRGKKITMDGLESFVGEDVFKGLSKNKKLQIEDVAKARAKYIWESVKRAEKSFDVIFDQFGHFEDEFFEELEELKKPEVAVS